MYKCLAVRTPELDFSSQSSSLSNYVPANQIEQVSTHQGFTFVGRTPVTISSANIGHLSHYLRKSAHLFDLVSSTSDIGNFYLHTHMVLKIEFDLPRT